MDDKYKALRDNLHVLQAEAIRKGGINHRSQMILDLLEERDQLAAAARVAAQQAQPFKVLPLCSSPLSPEEAIRLSENLKTLLRFLSAPGDWGHETKLGKLTIVLRDLLAELNQQRRHLIYEEENL